MILTSDMVYISIESRKGGVGKTTTAITLAETLLGKGYQVLIIDMDIVGTTLDPTFISDNKDIIYAVKLNGKSVNLVKLFKDVYMAGKNIPAFALEGEKKDSAFSFARDKCNFIGANIYDQQGETTPLEDPRILYDAFHAYWLLEFVKGISKSFEIATGNEVKVAVILDNSPGFSSIENSVHDFLTDLGPEKGKVLLVSTIDPQDIEACRQSKKVFEERFYDKVDAGKYFRSMAAGDFRKKKDSPAFESVWNCLCASGGNLPVYHSELHEMVPPYISILVNKVPVNLYEQLFAKGIIKRDSEFVAPFQNHLLYYFSNAQLTANGIAHQLVYSERGDQYLQTGEVVNIENDDARYLDFCEVSHKIGLGDFFKPEWSPLTCFRDLLGIMQAKGIIKEMPQGKVQIREGDYADKENRLIYEVETVNRYVLANLQEESRFKEILPDIDEFVTSVISKQDGGAVLDFHPDHPKLQEIEDFVSVFGLATYRLHIYKEVCKMFNILIGFCLEHVENLERLSKDDVSCWIENVLEGRVPARNLDRELEQIRADQRNARALSKSLHEIIKTWGL